MGKAATGVQFDFLLDLVRRGGSMGDALTTKEATRAACERRGWITAHSDITPAGRLACAAFDARAYGSTLAAVRAAVEAAESKAGPHVRNLCPSPVGCRQCTAPDTIRRALDEPVADPIRPGERARGPVIDTQIPDLMSVTEVARHHGVSRTAVQKAIDAGKLPARKVGETWVVRREVVEAAGESITI